MAKFNGLDKMSFAELRDLRARVDEAMVEREAEERRELKAKLEALAAESGFSVTQLFEGGKGRRGKAGIAVVKYRNPKDASQTWSGRGRKPGWLNAAVAKGAKIESFEV
ncbi:MAG: H-NS histone family protein [Hyphomicrobium sp.]